ncbi:hypothetical protein I317_04769 [Kwoniella heveanensis CBS 569]|uniref:Uncharacterized protein n=1 Tax=Kwoniella heveanensis BCC8398 TaxID=1296120 RepID=A0A1B9GQC8_9TREE|nr:hypothetical protein I316_05040 [Kwoniella heveanensis BCC8398]OCF41378.1 hypothetical protein I317_04769 [Kwoniella heveanensis CBS 569]
MATEQAKTDNTTATSATAPTTSKPTLSLSSLIGIETTDDGARKSGYIWRESDVAGTETSGPAYTPYSRRKTSYALSEQITASRRTTALQGEWKKVGKWMKGKSATRPTDSWHSIVQASVDAVNAAGEAPHHLVLLNKAEDDEEFGSRFEMSLQEVAAEQASREPRVVGSS